MRRCTKIDKYEVWAGGGESNTCILRYTSSLALPYPRSVIDNLSLIGDHLSLEGHRRANSSSLQSNLPISSSGSIVFSLDQWLLSIYRYINLRRVNRYKYSPSILDPRILHLFADSNLTAKLNGFLLFADSKGWAVNDHARLNWHTMEILLL